MVKPLERFGPAFKGGSRLVFGLAARRSQASNYSVELWRRRVAGCAAPLGLDF